jgi:HEAT repeat protein
MQIMKNTKLQGAGLLLTALFACASLLSGRDAGADVADTITGTQRVYGNIAPDQIEHLSTGDRIKSATASGSMMAIWETLEHGERVECLDCIPSVEPLIYDPTPRTREIAAWWLRRRVFGVWGPGEVYERTILTLATDPNAERRAYAAEALGEFLADAGVDAVATAITKDTDPNVRAAAAKALGRLHSDGKGALSTALSDTEGKVKLAALHSAGRLNNFSDVAAVTKLISDGDPAVRRGAAEVIGTLRAKEGVDGLMNIAKNDPDSNVRNAACHSLGALHDARARSVLEDVSNTDSNGLVRDQATIALRRL